MRDLKHRILVASDGDVKKIIRTQDVQEVFFRVVDNNNLIILLMDNGKEYTYLQEPVDLFHSMMHTCAAELERYMSEYVDINSYVIS